MKKRKPFRLKAKSGTKRKIKSTGLSHTTDDVLPVAKLPVTLTIEGPPSVKKNSMTIAYSGHRKKPILMYSKSYAAALKTQLPQLKRQWQWAPVGSEEHPLHISFSFTFKDRRRRDLDNLISSALDLLGKAGVIENDKWVYSVDGTRMVYGTGTEHTVILIGDFE